MAAPPLDAIDIFDPVHLDDPYPLYRTLREQAPVYRVPGTNFHLVTSWELVAEAAGRTTDFSSNLTAVLIQQPEGPPAIFDMDGGGQALHVLATADAPGHSAQRKLVSTVLAKRIRELGPTVSALVDQLWAEQLRDGRMDWATGMADRLPLALVAEVIGLPAADVPRLLRWAYDSTEMLGGVMTPDRLPVLVTAAAELTAYLAERFAADETGSTAADLSDAGTPDLLRVLARARDAGVISDAVAVLVLVQLVGAGGESTAGLIANAARILATRPDLQTLLREQPHLVPAFLEETLRFESPFRGHHRHVTADTTLGGVDLPAGSHLLLMWGAANRDPAVFADPDVFDPHRPNARSHSAFGRGLHFCVGSALAKMEAVAAVTALLDRSTEFTLAGSPRWVPSIMVRRQLSLPLQIR
ncbi:cytochrome P450 [Nocardia sp. 2]|uniref:Cytochrome P450 n=1 Tax=Nocardia acididurans TaxID=2802282 RepID=A0ABS1M3V4_9NOCA|nr:cytochrome P450 [Nocardia acididurans]MBL1075348.1 cytochrome P450 [Nocardia acididurans]